MNASDLEHFYSSPGIILRQIVSKFGLAYVTVISI